MKVKSKKEIKKNKISKKQKRNKNGKKIRRHCKRFLRPERETLLNVSRQNFFSSQWIVARIIFSSHFLFLFHFQFHFLFLLAYTLLIGGSHKMIMKSDHTHPTTSLDQNALGKILLPDCINTFDYMVTQDDNEIQP